MPVIDEQKRMQQFYLRTVLSVGLIWGTFLLVQLLVFVITPGDKGSYLDSLAVIINCLSVFPASVLGFWHRRAACVWLTSNAIFISSTTAHFALHTQRYDPEMIVGVLLSVALALSLLIIEIRQWPGALARSAR